MVATDTAGNTATTTAVSATVDTTGPTETIRTTIDTDGGSAATIASGGVTKDTTLGLSGTVSDTNGVSSVHVFDGSTDLGAATVSGGNWSLTTTALSEGSHSFTAVATDTAGNTTTTSAVTATIDSTEPDLVTTFSGVDSAGHAIEGSAVTVAVSDDGAATAANATTYHWEYLGTSGWVSRFLAHIVRVFTPGRRLKRAISFV